MPRRLALVFASSLLYILSFPTFNLSWLAWVGLVPLALSVRESTTKAAFFQGWGAGTVAYAGLLYWIVVTFQAAQLSLPLALFSLFLLSGYLGLFWGAWTFYLARLRLGRTGIHEWIDPLIGAAAWVALEYLRTYLFSGFPWTLWADSQVQHLHLLQIASVTGVYGLSFLGISVTLALAHGRWKGGVVPLILLTLTLLFGSWRLAEDSGGTPPKGIRVALLQGSIDQYKKWDQAYVTEIQTTYERLIQEAARAQPDLMLWPETSVPGYLLQDPSLLAWVQKTVKASHTAHLIGSPSTEDKQAYNAAFSINAEGQIEGEYAKQHLVPFGEVVPWAGVLGRYISVLNALGGFTAGTRSPVVHAGGIPLGVNICYEALFPNLVRHSVKKGATLLANMTNDGWYMKTSAPYQHWAPNVFRAVENDRWLIRADNTGVSGIIDPRGRVVASSRIFEPAVVQGTAYARTTQTPYTRWGDGFAWICILFCCFIFVRKGILD